MARKIYRTNLKGGTGVTTCCVGLALALASLGERCAIFDGDNLSGGALEAGGCANMQTYTLADYSKGACRAKQTLIPHPANGNLSFVSSTGLEDLSFAGKAVGELDGLFDYIILDKIAKEKCDCAIIVTEPFIPSVKCADICKARLSDSGIKDIALIVNKLNGGQVLEGEVMTAQEIAKILKLPLRAVIPEDLTLPLGRCKKSTKKAFKVAAENICGKSADVCNVLKGYFGVNGYIKRKVRERL